jgi:uncharacterized protein (DUF433 family)
MQAMIIDRGRGPEIAGTRITVYDILDHLKDGWHHTRIAVFLRLSSEQVLAAVKYIEEHKEEVMADYRQILERAARGNPPEIVAKLEASRAKLQAELERRRLLKAEGVNHARNLGGQ